MEKESIKTLSNTLIVITLIIAGTVLLINKDKNIDNNIQIEDQNVAQESVSPITSEDRVIGNNNAKISIIIYGDFQCPFCGAITGLDNNAPIINKLRQQDPNWEPYLPKIRDNYIKDGKIKLAYRDYPFLGEGSLKTAEAGYCANEQGKFWEYHDYIYANQNTGENTFSNSNLKTYAKILGLNQLSFNTCLDSGKYSKKVLDAKNNASALGIEGTPRGYIFKEGILIDIIDGAIPSYMVEEKLNSILD